MKIDDATETLARFFNDLIGAFVPGAVLAVGFCAMHFGFGKASLVAKGLDGSLVALLALGLLFAVGHGLLAIYDFILMPAFELVLSWLQKRVPDKWSLRLSLKFDMDAAKEKQSYKSFLGAVQRLGKDSSSGAKPSWGYNDLRSIAFSVSTDAASLGRRFMFISLLCCGVGTAVFVLVLDFVVCSLFVPSLLYSYSEAAPWGLQVTILSLVAGTFLKRGVDFYKRAMETPFSVAFAELELKRVTDAK